MERQLAQIAEKLGTREPGKLPSNTVVNPVHNQDKGKEHQVHQVNSIGVLYGGMVSAHEVSVSIPKDAELINMVKSNKGSETSKVGEVCVEVNNTPHLSTLEHKKIIHLHYNIA